MRREVLYKGWVHGEWSPAHEVGWRSTGEYNGWLVLEHWWLVWEAYGYRTRGRSRQKIGWIVTSTMKSMVIVSHIPLGILLGWIGTLVGGHIFVVWQMVHPCMYALMNSVMPGHQYSLESNSIVFHWPGCPIKLS